MNRFDRGEATKRKWREPQIRVPSVRWPNLPVWPAKTVAVDVRDIERLDRIERRRPGRGARQADVDRDAMEPGAERRVALKTGKAAVGADERLLRHLFRDGGYADHEECEPVHPGLVPAHEDGCRVRVARGHPGVELGELVGKAGGLEHRSIERQ